MSVIRNVAVVIPVGPGREDNLIDVAICLRDQVMRPQMVVIIEDGPAVPDDTRRAVETILGARRCVFYRAMKHEPGMEQPRNVGVRVAQTVNPDLKYVIFLDSDVVVDREWLADIHRCYKWREEKRAVLVCPYDWLPPGLRLGDESFWEQATATLNDPR